MMILAGSGNPGNFSDDAVPSCSYERKDRGPSSGSISRVEFLETRIKWQDKMIDELQRERDFLRRIIGGNKGSSDLLSEKLVGLLDSHDSLTSNISDSSDSEVIVSKRPKVERPPLAEAKRQRGHNRIKGPAEVIKRYLKVLKSFRHVRTMSEAFRVNRVDRWSFKKLAPIAELNIVDPETYKSLVFEKATETLVDFAKKCAAHVTTEKKAIIEDLKGKGKLLPLLVYY